MKTPLRLDGRVRGGSNGDDRRFRIEGHEAWRQRAEAETYRDDPDADAGNDATDPTPASTTPRWRRPFLVLAIVIPLAGLLLLGAYNGVLLASNQCPDDAFFRVEDPETRCGLTGNRCVMRPDAAALQRERVCTFPSDGRIHLAFRLIGGGEAYVSLDAPSGENVYNAAHPGSVAPPADPYELVQRNLSGANGVWTVRIMWTEMPADLNGSMIVVWG